MTLAPMTDAEILAWVRLLPGAIINKQKIIKNLVFHANEDRMNMLDRMACQRALHLLHVALSKGVKV